MPALDDPFYYLANFHTVLDWVEARSGDLLDTEEQAFLADFRVLPRASQALLVRLVMRKGTLFRSERLRYVEIGEIGPALSPLLAHDWVEADPVVSLDDVAALLTRDELIAAFASHITHRSARKPEMLAQVRTTLAGSDLSRRWSSWLGEALPRLSESPLLALRIMERCDRLRLMFFGNLHQDWATFVLADLGLYQYERVAFDAQSRAFRHRGEVDAWLQLHRCREDFEGGALSLEQARAALPPAFSDNPWLEARRGRLLFGLGQAAERAGEVTQALQCYQHSNHRESRIRAMRVAERNGDPALALSLALELVENPRVEAEAQAGARALPRLQRRLDLPRQAPRRPAEPARIDLTLPPPAQPVAVEQQVAQHLARAHAPVFYVENQLINSLFGLLCWEAIFAPLPGAFFHPFQSGPADLFRPEFHERRHRLFEHCFAQLADGRYRDTIRANYHRRQGLLSPFVHWQGLDPELLELALLCLPAAHLSLFFGRILADLKANRSGLPDLIQFWPAQGRYRLVEVKGPGDRLQDNQLRWLAFCGQHDIPAAVCYLRHTAPSGSDTCPGVSEACDPALTTGARAGR